MNNIKYGAVLYKETHRVVLTPLMGKALVSLI